MILLTHIAIALLSLLVAGLALARPSMKSAKIVAGLTAATLVSGGALLFEGANILHLCASGLLFASLTSAAVALVVRRTKLAEQL